MKLGFSNMSPKLKNTMLWNICAFLKMKEGRMNKSKLKALLIIFFDKNV